MSSFEQAIIYTIRRHKILVIQIALSTWINSLHYTKDQNVRLRATFIFKVVSSDFIACISISEEY
jgi:hypothetical protein